MSPRREIRKKSSLLKIRLRNHSKDAGQGFLADLSRVIGALKEALLPKEVDISIGVSEETVIEEIDAGAFDRRNEHLETLGREEATSQLEQNAREAERLAHVRGDDPELPAPFDPEERKRAQLELEEKVRELQAKGYRVTFEPDADDETRKKPE